MTSTNIFAAASADFLLVNLVERLFPAIESAHNTTPFFRVVTNA
jgi:hypothetical protein